MLDEQLFVFIVYVSHYMYWSLRVDIFVRVVLNVREKLNWSNISVTMDTGNDDMVDAHSESSFMHVFMCIQISYDEFVVE